MSYQALYRKFRPDHFEDVKGQDAIVKTLVNQVTSDRIGHAYLFCGTRGTGKTSVAKILARAVNCESPVNGSPCNKCPTCRSILAGTSMNVIEIDAASNNGVDNIREIREEVTYRPTEGRYKVYIVDEVHMLSTGAFNALLKTLEEPPSYVIFILATTEAHKIPLTILSRCQRYDFRRIPLDTIAGRLTELLREEQVEAEPQAIRYIAKAGDGSMRDSLSLLDQCIAFYMGEKLTYDKVLDVIGAVDTEVFSRLFRRILAADAYGAIQILEEIVMNGRELSQFVTDFIWYLRNILIIRTTEDPEGVVDLSSENRKLLEEEAAMAEEETLMRYIRVLSELSGQMRYASQKRVLVEVAIIRLCRPAMETKLDSLLDRVRVLEKRMDEAPPAAAPAERAVPQQEKPVRKPDKEPPAAVPEDLRRIAENWPAIVGETTALLKQLLKRSVPSYDGTTGDPVLYVHIPEPDFLARKLKDEEYARELDNAIRKKTGVRVEIRFVFGEEDNTEKLAALSVEDMLRENIHYDVETEDF